MEIFLYFLKIHKTLGPPLGFKSSVRLFNILRHRLFFQLTGTVTLPPDQERRSSPGMGLLEFNAPLLPQPHITWHFAFSSNLCLEELVGQLGVGN